MHGQAHLFFPPERSGKGRKRLQKSLFCIEIRKAAGVFPHPGFQRMGQHVKSSICNQSPGQIHQQVTVKNRELRTDPRIHQGVLHPLMGENGKVRHLRT